MTTIGYATLQIIPSLRGVSAAITKELEGQTIEVAVDPKVDQAAAKKAGKEAGDAIVKETRDAVSKGDVGKVIAEDVKKSTTGVGRQAGDKIAKETKDAVRKGDIGKEVADDVKESVEKAGPGREIAKVIVDGLAQGVKQGLPDGGIGEVIVDGLAEGVKKGVDSGGLSTTIVGSITDSLKGGDLSGKLKDAVIPGIKGIGDQIKAGVGEWSSGIADSFKAGDIEGATSEISEKVLSTTNTIAGIGEMFGLQTDGLTTFAENAVTQLSGVTEGAQGITNAIGVLPGTFGKISDSLGKLDSKAAKTATAISSSLAAISVPGWLAILLAGGSAAAVSAGANDLIDKGANLPAGRTPRLNNEGQAVPNATDAAPRRDPGDASTPQKWLEQANKNSTREEYERRLKWITENFPDRDKRGDPWPSGGPPPAGSYRTGGYTGNVPISKIAGVVHGDEFVIKSPSRQILESAHPGLLDHMNDTGRLPGYEGGGLVAGTAELRKIIGDRFGISDIGGYRPADKYGEHSTGRALDVMVGNNKSKGDAVKDFVLKNADALDLKWVIWRQHLYYGGGGGYDMEDRGNPTQNHMDHVHIFSGTGIANGIRGALQGTGAALDSNAMLAALGAGGPGTIDPTSTDQSGAGAPAKTPSAPHSSGGGGGIPASLTGLSTIGLSNLGVTTQVGPNTPERTLDIGGVADAAIGGQVSSALGVLGVGNSPPWLQAASKLISGIKVSDRSGNSLFDGGNLFGSAAPLAATPSGAGGVVPSDTQHGTRAGQQPGPVYNIQTAKVEDAFLQARRIENEKAAAKLSRF